MKHGRGHWIRHSSLRCSHEKQSNENNKIDQPSFRSDSRCQSLRHIRAAFQVVAQAVAQGFLIQNRRDLILFQSLLTIDAKRFYFYLHGVCSTIAAVEFSKNLSSH